MPRFSENEKEQIRTKLLIEGESLFSTFGLKKVTIDEITAAVNIAKATFYTFYDSKEALYLDIIQSTQAKIFAELDTLLSSNTNYNSKQRVKQVFAAMYQLMLQYPLLSQINSNTITLISRKVDAPRLTTFVNQNIDAAHVLAKNGIAFTCTPEIASHVFQALYQGWLSLKDKETAVQEQVTDILLEGVIDRILFD